MFPFFIQTSHMKFMSSVYPDISDGTNLEPELLLSLYMRACAPVLHIVPYRYIRIHRLINAIKWEIINYLYEFFISLFNLRLNFRQFDLEPGAGLIT